MFFLEALTVCIKCQSMLLGNNLHEMSKPVTVKNVHANSPNKTVCMICQSLFPYHVKVCFLGKNKKHISKWVCLKSLPSTLKMLRSSPFPHHLHQPPGSLLRDPVLF